MKWWRAWRAWRTRPTQLVLPFYCGRYGEACVYRNQRNERVPGSTGCVGAVGLNMTQDVIGECNRLH